MADANGVALVRRSPLHHVHRTLGARPRVVSGWEMAAAYGPVEEEQASLLSTGGICDVSDTAKLVVQGHATLQGLQTLDGVESPVPGSVHVLADDGGDGPVTVAVLTSDEAIIIAAPNDGSRVMELVEGALAGCAHVTDVTSTRAGVLVVGPQSHTVLSKVVEFDVDPHVFPSRTCAQGRAAGTHVLLVRVDAAGTPCYLLYVTRDHAEHLWDALVSAGRAENVGPVSLDALAAVVRAD